jgi:hypothetical protein
MRVRRAVAHVATRARLRPDFGPTSARLRPEASVSTRSGVRRCTFTRSTGWTRGIEGAARTRQHDEGRLKRVGHLVARFGAAAETERPA